MARRGDGNGREERGKSGKSREVQGGGWLGGEGLGNEEGGALWGGRSEGRAEGSVYTCHLLLLRAKNTEGEQEMGKTGREGGGGGGKRGHNAGSSIAKQACIYFEAEIHGMPERSI